MTTEPNKTKINCSACGTAPINHTFALVSSVMEGVIGDPMNKLMGWLPIVQGGIIMNTFDTVFVSTLRLLRGAKMNTDPEKAASGRSKLIWDEAIRRNIQMQQVVIFGKPMELYRAKINNKWSYFESIPVPPWLAQGGYKWLDDKFELKRRLKKGGIPVPGVFKVSTWKQAERAFGALRHPVIIKPRSGSRGRHTTTNIETLSDLKKAYKLVNQIDISFVIEEHLYGSVCRATIVGGKLAGFFKADPPQVEGDGIHNVKELIEITNKNRPERLSDIEINDDLTEFIKREGYTLESILENKKTLNLSAKTGRFYGGKTKEMFSSVHPKMHEIFERAAKIVGVPVAGFDLIIEDPEKDPDSQKWGIIECNSLPFIDLHFFPLEGEPNDISKKVWDLWDKK